MLQRGESSVLIKLSMKLNFSTSWCIGFSYNLWTLDEQISIFRNLIQRTIECLILSPSRSNEDPCSSEIEFNFPDKPCLRWLVGLNHQHTLVIVSQHWLSSQSLEGQDYMLIITLISQSQSLLWCFWTSQLSRELNILHFQSPLDKNLN